MSQQDFVQKNLRVYDALKRQQPYWLLMDKHPHMGSLYYALIQINNDRVPVTIMFDMFGYTEIDWAKKVIDTSLVQALIGYDAEIVVGRYTKIETSPAGLLTEIVSVILASIEDDSMGNGLWKVNEDGKSGFACNRFSRDPGRSSNGGDYFYYRQFEVTDAGVLSRDSWSADFYLDPAETLHKVDIANLQPIFDQAVEIVKAILSGDKAHVCSCCGRPFAYVKK